MGVPKHRTSASKRDKRRTHKKLSLPTFSRCPQCHEPLLSHHVCLHCGAYKGKEVIPVEQE